MAVAVLGIFLTKIGLRFVPTSGHTQSTGLAVQKEYYDERRMRFGGQKYLISVIFFVQNSYFRFRKLDLEAI